MARAEGPTTARAAKERQTVARVLGAENTIIAHAFPLLPLVIVE